MSPPLSVQLTETFTALLMSSEKLTHERVGTDGEPEEMDELYMISLLVDKSRAGGNGTAGTVMAVPDFEGEKWRRLDSNLRLRL